MLFFCGVGAGVPPANVTQNHLCVFLRREHRRACIPLKPPADAQHMPRRACRRALACLQLNFRPDVIWVKNMSSVHSAHLCENTVFLIM